mmetsp:Transcript_10212/g.24544  ORF Transcript_10212/g.24544 Transcript_10212/m.24544 type:complete len:322 (+) Transcript_10212:29-994(+)
MIIVNVVLKIVVASSAAYLSSQCAKNMIETRHVVNDHHHEQQQKTRTRPASLPSSSIGVNSIGSCDAEIATTTTMTKTEKIVVEYLSSLTKRQLLELFCHCEPPAVSLSPAPNVGATATTTGSTVDGDWDGYLLANNGLTKISNILTHALFSGLTPRLRQRRRWIGKQFSSQPTKLTSETDFTSTESRIGMNRFRRFDDVGNDNLECDDINFFFNQHQFDYWIEDSKIQPGTKSLILKYNRYQSLSFLSPWHTMRDEIRILPESLLRSIQTLGEEKGGGDSGSTTNITGTTTDVLLGMGSMAWSGGALNSAPFCLIRSTKL